MATEDKSLYPHVTLLMVMSINGVVAQQSIQNSFDWNSEADRVQFLEKVKSIGVAVMGSNTYRSIGEKPYKDLIFYVMTSNPGFYNPYPGAFFRQGSVTKVLAEIKQSGIQKVALLGGPNINAQCLEQGLVDEMYLTIEPLLMPEGLHFADGLTQSKNLKLLSLDELNESKTLLAHYQVIN